MSSRYDTPGLGSVVLALQSAVAQARRAAIPVVFTRHVYRPGRADEGGALIRNSPALAGINGLAAGFWDADVVDELGCGPEELVVDKVRFDARTGRPAGSPAASRAGTGPGTSARRR